MLQTLVETIRIYATQQDMTQRYMTAESTRRANQSVWLSILGYVPLGYLFYFIGTGLFVFYQTHPDPAVAALESANRLDSLYAYFVVTQMPAGLAGLVIAAFFAAAMSTIASSMNSASAVCVEDFYRRFWARGRSDEHYLRVAKWLALAWGVLHVVMAILFSDCSGPVAWSQVMAICTCVTSARCALFAPCAPVPRWPLWSCGAAADEVLPAGDVEPGAGLPSRQTPINFPCGRWSPTTSFGVALLLDRLLRAPSAPP